LLIKRWRAADQRAPSMNTLRVMFPYAWRSAGAWSATSLTARLDQVVLAVAVGSTQLGLYSVAVAASSITNPLTAGVSLALFGHLRSDPNGTQAMKRFRRSVTVTLVLTTVVAVVIGGLAPILVRLAFGREFTDAAQALRLLLPGTVAVSLLAILSTKLSAEGRPGELTRASLLGAGFTVVGLLIVVRPFGIEGAAGVTSLAYVLQVGYLIGRGACRPHQSEHPENDTEPTSQGKDPEPGDVSSPP
jgi:O-antigen/teichoic acid export membrane protein